MRLKGVHMVVVECKDSFVIETEEEDDGMNVRVWNK